MSILFRISGATGKWGGGQLCQEYLIYCWWGVAGGHGWLAGDGDGDSDSEQGMG
jgi:hypothetical protein